MAKHWVIGLTGGVGCGKSSVAYKISQIYDKNVQFIYTDELAHQLMQPGGPTYKALLEEYGTKILENNEVDIDGAADIKQISREKLKEAVISSLLGFLRLNELTHPIVKRETQKLIDNSEAELIVVEAALLIEADMHTICDDVWYVYADEAERRSRLKTSRGYSDEYIDKLFANQLSEAAFRENATFILNNHDGQADVEEQIKSRVDQIKKKR